MERKNLDYVLCILKGEEPKITPEWYEVLGFLTANRVFGLFYLRAKKSGIYLPSKIEKILCDGYRAQFRRVTFMRGETAALSKALRKFGAEHIFLKGSVFTAQNDADAIYKDGERISNDIDILVKPNGIEAVCAALGEAGYIQGQYDYAGGRIIPYPRLEILKRRLTRGETAPFIKLTGNRELPFVEADVNFSLGNEPSEHRALLETMIDTRVLCCGKTTLYRAESELLFLHLILHQYKESSLYFSVQRGKTLDLYKLADIYYLWHSPAFDRNKLLATARKYDVVKETGAVLGQTGRVFSDNELLQAANELGDIGIGVYDYDTKKRYVWTAEEKVRLLTCDGGKFLEERETT